MKQTTAAKAPTPSPDPGKAKSRARVGKINSPSSVFVGLALDMSWRLALVVLLPIIGGFELDQHLGTSPLLVIVGFVLACLGMFLVLWQTLQTANNLPLPASPKKEKQS